MFVQFSIKTVPRPEEVDPNIDHATESTIYDEGTSAQFNRDYILALETELELKRTFTIPGQEYQVVLRAHNMHNENDSAILIW